MSNKNIQRSTVTAGLLVFCGFFLASCGESTNIKSSNNGGTTTKCADLGVDCVAGRFIDDAVYNLNYTCGAVTAVTDFDGSFACPLTSQVRFYIKNPDNGLEIDLGTTTVKNTPQTNIADYFYVTPKTLTGDETAQKNIVRLLQSLSRDTVLAGSPDHLVILDDADKKKISFAVAQTDFSKSAAAFALFIKPYLDSLSPAVSLISETDAESYLRNGVYSTMAGVYSVPGIPFTVEDPSLLGKLGGMVGANNFNKRLIGTFWTLVDRKGRIMGGGAYSFEDSSVTNQNLYTNTKAMEFASYGTPSAEGFYFWPTSGTLAGLFFRMKDDANAATSKTLNITAGTLDRGVIAGSNEVYKTYFGDATAPTLGRWQLNDSSSASNNIDSTNAVVAPAYTLIRTVPAAPTLDPDSWEQVRPGFPLNVAINFYDNDTSVDDGSGNKGALINTTGPVRVTVLADGNIVSDKNHDCNAGINFDTLKDSKGQQEVPLGLVQNIFPKNGALYMTVIMMIPNSADYDADLRYVQTLTNLSGVSSSSKPVYLRVDGSAATNTNYLALVDSDLVVKKALWYNAWKSYRSIGNSSADTKKMQGRMTSSAVPASDCI